MTQNKLNDLGKKKPKQESQIVETQSSWLSKNNKAIFITLPVDDVKKIDIQEYVNKEGETIEQIQLVTSVEALERVLADEIKATKLGFFKKK